MSLKHSDRESRRSTRVPLKVWIEAKGVTEPLTCEGETIVVNLHGARVSTTVPLRVGMRIQIYVILTDKHALAQVVYVDPDRPRTVESHWRARRIFGECLLCPMIGTMAIPSDL